MAQLFSKGTIKNEVQAIAGLDIAEKIAIVQKILEDNRKGLTVDETAYEQSFNEYFFRNLLGYEWNTHMRPKAKVPVGGDKPDVGLGIFPDGIYNHGTLQIVVELKGSKIFLDKKQNRQNSESPVDQGFRYKVAYPSCKRLIVTNYFVIRLYRDNKQDYEERNIADLAKGDDNFFQLRKLLILLSAKRLLAYDGQSHTERLLTQFRIEQQKITKKFYQEYKGLRLELINDMRHNNPELDIETAVEKAQKIIDRLVFVHFCEDKGLLPADKLKENIVRAHEADFTPWEVLKKYFKGVDSGSEKLGIPLGYNGELFKPDAILDGLEIGDTICKKFIAFGDYDFDDELSVNILGHIFEQSISDLEQLKIDLLGTEVEIDQLVENKKQSKRKKDGIFYTPEYIVDYIVQNSLMKYLSEKEDECLAKYKNEQKAYQAYQQILQNVKVLDPACGSGAFLVKVFDVLYAENQRVGILIGGLFDETETYKNILTNNIYGVDLNPESVEITKLSLWLKSAQKGRKLNNLDKNIKCGNSLIDDPAVAGERAFDWKKEFKGIMDGGGFDVIVGNPPYVAGKDLSDEHKKYFKSSYQFVAGKFDLYLLFVERSISLAKFVSLIIPNTILVNENGTQLRRMLLETNTIEYIRFFSDKVFSDANVESVILAIGSGKKSFDLCDNDGNAIINIVNREILADDFCRILIGKNNNDKKILEKINTGTIKVGDIADICIGIQLGGHGNSSDFKDKYISDVKKDDTFQKCLDGKDFDIYFTNWKSKYISYGDRLHRKRDQKFFLSPKIMIRQIGKTPVCNVDFDGYYTLNTIYNMISISNNYDLKYVFLLINSALLKYFRIKEFSDNKELFPKVKKSQLVNIPIKKISLKDQQPFIDKADQMLALNKEFHEKKSSALSLIQAEYGIDKVSRKLESFWELDFADFVKSLGVKSLSLDKKEELMGWFGKKKEELAGLKNTIDQVDKEIDEMVYALYGLSEEEVRVVEGK